MEILHFFEVLTLIITFYYLFDISFIGEINEGKNNIKQKLVY